MPSRRVYLRTPTLAEGVGVVCPLETFPLPSPDEADVGWNWLARGLGPEVLLVWRVSDDFTSSEGKVHVFLRSTFSYRRSDRPGPLPRDPTPEEVDLLKSLVPRCLHAPRCPTEAKWIRLDLEDPPRRQT